MPAKENGVQSSTISYSDVVIPDGITNKVKSQCGTATMEFMNETKDCL